MQRNQMSAQKASSAPAEACASASLRRAVRAKHGLARSAAKADGQPEGRAEAD
jgi:hypothetical protein